MSEPETLYDVSVVLHYSYSAPAAASRNLLRLTPLSLPGIQQTISGLVEAEPKPDVRRDLRDFFGNAVVDLAYSNTVSELKFRYTGRVRRTSESLSLDLSPDAGRLAEEIAEDRCLSADAPHHFLGNSDRVRPEPEMTAYARDLIEKDLAGGLPVLEAVLRVGRALHRDLTFDPLATEVNTTPLAAFRQRSGVCQDFSHIMIACLRGLSIPAGYVSGLLRTEPPPGEARLEGADAMHAWVRAWCGSELGWVEYDPTNDMLVGNDHIVIGYGRDYADVAPIRGALRASGGHAGRQLVDVLPVSP